MAGKRAASPADPFRPKKGMHAGGRRGLALLLLAVWVVCLPLARATDGLPIENQTRGSILRDRALLQQQGEKRCIFVH